MTVLLSLPPPHVVASLCRGPFFQLCKTRAFLRETMKRKWKTTRPTDDGTSGCSVPECRPRFQVAGQC